MRTAHPERIRVAASQLWQECGQYRGTVEEERGELFESLLTGILDESNRPATRSACIYLLGHLAGTDASSGPALTM